MEFKEIQCFNMRIFALLVHLDLNESFFWEAHLH